MDKLAGVELISFLKTLSAAGESSDVDLFGAQGCVYRNRRIVPQSIRFTPFWRSKVDEAGWDKDKTLTAPSVTRVTKDIYSARFVATDERGNPQAYVWFDRDRGVAMGELQVAGVVVH